METDVVLRRQSANIVFARLQPACPAGYLPEPHLRAGQIIVLIISAGIQPAAADWGCGTRRQHRAVCPNGLRMLSFIAQGVQSQWSQLTN
jgi:hypothetical protein